MKNFLKRLLSNVAENKEKWDTDSLISFLQEELKKEESAKSAEETIGSTDGILLSDAPMVNEALQLQQACVENSAQNENVADNETERPAECETQNVAPMDENPQDSEVLIQLTSINEILKSLEHSVSEKEKLQKMTVEMHEELVRFRNGLVDDVKKPLLNSLVLIYDRLEDLCRSNARVSETEVSAQKILKTLNDIKLNCLDLLYEFDIEPVTLEIGSAFIPKEQKAIKIIPTNDVTKDKTVAEIRQIGFKNISNQRMLRVSSVEVFKKEEK